MSPEERNLLIRCAELTDELAANEPEKWKEWVRREWEEQTEFGPRYAVSRWFGPTRERDRMRYRRAIERLEEAGLLATFRLWDSRLTHVGLTADGRKVADQLSAEFRGHQTSPDVPQDKPSVGT